MPTELWLVRHGARLDYARPTWRKEIVSNGGDVRDPPLSPLGHRQARMVAENYFLRLPEGARPQRILVSPYLRVITTAAPTADALGLALELELGLAETHFVPDRLPSAAQRFRYLPMVDPASGGAASLIRPAATPGHYVEALGMARQDHAEEGGGSMAVEAYPKEYLRRIKAFAPVLEAAIEGQRVSCFSHAASLSLVAALLGSDLQTPGRFAPCGVFHLRKGDEEGAAWELLQKAEDNSAYVTVQDEKTFPWTFELPEGALPMDKQRESVHDMWKEL